MGKYPEKYPRIKKELRKRAVREILVANGGNFVIDDVTAEVNKRFPKNNPSDRHTIAKDIYTLFDNLPPEILQRQKAETAKEIFFTDNAMKHLLNSMDLNDREDVIKNEKVVGDATPQYIWSKVAAEEIYKFNPNAKIVVTFREPIEMLSSIHAQLVFNLTEDKNFEEALKLEPVRKKGKDLPNTKRQIPPYLFFYSEYITYAKCLQRYLKLFPKENIKIILFDDFKKDTAQVVKDLLLFLEVDSEFKFNAKPHHVNKVVKHKKLKETIFCLLNSAPVQICKKTLPKSIRWKIAEILYEITTKRQKRKPLNPEFKKQLMKKYKPEVVKINNLLHKHELIEKDLVKLWSYDFPTGALNQNKQKVIWKNFTSWFLLQEKRKQFKDSVGLM